MFDAVVLSGGRSSRLGGVAKSSLQVDGRSLLARTCASLGAARRLVVVGASTPDVPAGHEVIREDPPFGGPAAAVSAAVAHLRADPAPWVLLLACDMPDISRALPALVAGAGAGGRSVLAHDGGRDQPLAALYRWADLVAAVDQKEVRNLSMRALLARVTWSPVEVPAGSTNDIDTWSDALQFGAEEPGAGK
ncbi:Molybdopterin-guanine dinucleotide biosynthesis protein A [Arthrobacter subterraneus]|uniref:Molybdopterin-guanine dinucleotide biosynthesis protein A n=2 Tax=Arthrobacter TaxID=1663 RepID=A0A1G8HFY3_9MICC|nr:Molybdopterin-guanine dinucleotide biosynthesis protein A [Arthrobacter subterraneus]